MANKIGIVLALDGEKEFANGIKNAQQSVKLFDQDMKNLEAEYKGQANSIEALTKKQELLQKKQQAYNRELDSAKAGQKNAVKNYQEATKNLDKLEKELEDARKAMKKMEDAGDTSSKAYKDQAKAVQALEKSVSKQADEQAKASTNITKWDTAVSKANGDVRKINGEVDKNSKYMNEAATSADKCAKSIDGMGNEMEDAAKESSTFGSSIKDALSVFAGNMMTKGFDLLVDGLKSASKYVVEVGSKFEASMSKVEALSGASGDQLQRMSDKAKELGSSTRFSASEVADGFSYMALAGWDTEEMLSSIDGVVNLAAASEMDLASASDMVTDYLSAFGLEASNAGKMADQMAYAQANSNTTTTQLGEAFGNCAANMNASGQSMETTTAILEAFANQGLKGSEAGTKLAAIMRDITAKMKDGKIQIGDTAVAVTDANGNFRDLTDILVDVDSATQGMGDAEKAAALAATFTSRSVSGLNMVLNEGVDKVQNYKEQLYNCEGAAAATAATMQDNLQGKLTEFSSALEGLGIAVFMKISGPLTAGVNFITGIIGNITKALSEEAEGTEKYLNQVKEANEEVERALQSAQDTIDSGEAEARGIEQLTTQLISLNEQESLSAGQKARLKEIVDQLGQSIPELAAAYDEETGKVNLTSEAIRNLTQAKADEIRQNAYLKANTELLEAYATATLELEKAKVGQERMRDQADLYRDLADSVQGASNAYSQYLDVQRNGGDAEEAFRNFVVERGKAIKALDEAYRTGKIGLEEYKKAQKEIDEIDWMNTNPEMWNSAGDAAQYFANKSGEAARGAEEMDEEIGDLGENVGNLKFEIDDTAEAVDRLTAGQEEAGTVTEGTSRRISGQVDDLGDLAGASKDASGAVDDLSDSEEKAEEAAKRLEEAHDKAAEAIKKAYEDAKKAAEDAFKLDAFSSEWGADAEDGIEKFKTAMQSQADAMTLYGENMQKVRERVGEVSPEFVKYLEEMGEAGSALVAELAGASDEQIHEIVEAWANATNVSSEIAEARTANVTAISAMLGEMGSTISEWNGLESAVQALGLKGTNRVLKEFESTVEAAKEMGIKIPEGLAESITENADQPEQALTQATAELNAAMKGQGEALVSAAKEMGIEVPQSIQEGIASGGDSAVQAYSDLIALLQSKNPELQQVGAEESHSIASGVESGSGDVSSATSAVVEAGVSAAITASQMFTEVGRTMDLATSAGMNAEKDSVSNRAQSVMESAKTSADNVAKDFKSVGTSAGTNFVSGLNSQRGSAVAAGSSVASGARSAAASYQNSFYSIGSFMGQGLSQGILSQANSIASAAASVVTRALAAARAAGAISSPSKKFRDKVGKEISAGVAWGIKQNTNLATDAAESMIGSTLAAMEKKLTKMKATASEATYAWQQTANSMLSKNFGVSKTTTTGSGKNQKTVAKDTETYYSDVYKQAQNFMNNLQVLYNVSDKQELAYWKKVQARLKRGTQSWYDATSKVKSLQETINEAEKEAKQERAEAEQERLESEAEQREKLLDIYENYVEKMKKQSNISIKQEIEYWKAVKSLLRSGTDEYKSVANKILNLQEQIGSFENASKILDVYQTYYEMSTGAEVEYWDIVRKSYGAGTTERINADKKYLAAKEKQTEQLKSLEDDYAEKVKEVNDKISDGIRELNEQYDDAIKKRTEEIAGAFDLFDAFESTSADGKTLLFNIQSQAAGYEFWGQEVSKLEGRGILSEKLLEEIIDKGPEAVANVVALNTLSDDDLKKYQEAYDKKMDESRKQAEKENESLKETLQKKADELKKSGADEIKTLTDNYNKKVKEVNDTIDDGLKTLAENIRSIADDEVNVLAAAITGSKLTDSSVGSSVGSNVNTGSATVASEANASISPTDAERDAALEVLTAGTKRSKTLTADEKKHSALKKYIITNYGVNVTTDMYKALATALGVKLAGNSPDASERSAILAALKAHGLRSGTRSLSTPYAWMDELGLGSELIVRKSDGAILNTAVQRGDAIIPANLTDNLYKWGAIDPDTVLPRVMSASSMNAEMASGYAAMSSRSGRDGRLDQMLDLMMQFMPYMAEANKVYVDGKELSKTTASSMGTEFAMRSRRRRG